MGGERAFRRLSRGARRVNREVWTITSRSIFGLDRARANERALDASRRGGNGNDPREFGTRAEERSRHTTPGGRSRWSSAAVGGGPTRMVRRTMGLSTSLDGGARDARLGGRDGGRGRRRW